MTRAENGFMPVDTEGVPVRRWQMPHVNGSAETPSGTSGPAVVAPSGKVSADRVAENGASLGANDRRTGDRRTNDVAEGAVSSAQQKGYDVGYRAGYEAGFDAGFEAGKAEALATTRAEISPLVESLNGAFKNLQAPLEQLTDKVQASLVALTVDIAQQFFLGTLDERPDRLRTMVAEALRRLPREHESANVSIHPDDFALLEQLEAAPLECCWSFDETLTRGGFVIDAFPSTIDATLESRYAEVVATLSAEAGATT